MQHFLRTFFHWQYSNFFIASFFATGVAMLTFDHFAPAYLFFIVAGIWAEIYWQVSDHLLARQAEVRKRLIAAQRKPGKPKFKDAVKKARYDYWTSSCIGSCVILGFTVLCLVWTESIQSDYELMQPIGWLIPAHDES